MSGLTNRIRGDASPSPALIAQLRAMARPLQRPEDLDPLLKKIGDARYVLLGEASHGTEEYYTWRATLSQRLIQEKGFSFIAVEGDWPDCYRVNRFIKGYGDAGESVREVLYSFERWPTWMWANTEIVEFAEWLHLHNRKQPEEKKVGFYGLDVYGFWDSLYAVLGYLRRADPNALPAARRAFRCFEPYSQDVQGYARATLFVPESCEKEVIDLLSRLRRDVKAFPDDGREAHFNAEQNALVVKNAEHYYRTMVEGGPEYIENIRDRRMTETLERLMAHHGPTAKAIVWEHNTHIGDARYTDMVNEGMVNVGQLVRDAHAREGVVLVGFGSYQGSVIAAQEWEAPFEWMKVPPAREGSWEHLLHECKAEDKLLLLAETGQTRDLLQPRGHRAIGVVYHPEAEQWGNYVPTVLPRRYDAFLYLDTTQALHPLHVPVHERGEVPQTYPSGV